MAEELTAMDGEPRAETSAPGPQDPTLREPDLFLVTGAGYCILDSLSRGFLYGVIRLAVSGGWRTRKPLDDVFALLAAHDGHTRDLADSPLEVTIVCCRRS